MKTLFFFLILFSVASGLYAQDSRKGSELPTATSTSASDYYIMLQSGTTKKVPLGTMYTNPAFTGTVFIGSDSVATNEFVRDYVSTYGGSTYYAGYAIEISNDSIHTDTSNLATLYDIGLKADANNPVFTGTVFYSTTDTLAKLSEVRSLVAAASGDLVFADTIDGTGFLETQYQADQKFNFSSAELIPYANALGTAFEYDTVFYYDPTGRTFYSGYRIYVRGTQGGTAGVADPSYSAIRFTDNEQDIIADIETLSSNGNLRFGTRVSGSEIEFIDPVNISGGSLTLPAGATVNNIQTTITDSDVAIPTSKAVADYVAANAGSGDFSYSDTTSGPLVTDHQVDTAKRNLRDEIDAIVTSGSTAGSGIEFVGDSINLNGDLTNSTTTLTGIDGNFNIIQKSADETQFQRLFISEDGSYEAGFRSGSNYAAGEAQIKTTYNNSTGGTAEMSVDTTNLTLRDSGIIADGQFYLPDLAPASGTKILNIDSSGKIDTTSAGGGLLFDPLDFTIGTTANAPSAGDSILVNDAFSNKLVMLFRDGLMSNIDHRNDTLEVDPVFSNDEWIRVLVQDSTGNVISLN